MSASGEMQKLLDQGQVESQGEIAGFPGGAYRANVYVYDPQGRIEWVALLPKSFAEGRYFTIGRSTDCNITLRDGSVSSKHAYIAAEGSELVLKDLGSTNGLLVNDEHVREVALRHGDVIRVGATDLRFLFSYKDAAAQLVLDFVGGPNAGKSVATYGSSTSIGRLNCGVNLQGTGVAPQHLRIDAYGRELIFVVNLRPENETWVNDQRVVGVTPAREGDTIRIGDHRLTLRVVEDQDVIDAVPQGEGTLQINQLSSMRGQAPVAQILISAHDMKRLAAAQPPEDDRTALDMQPALGNLLGPTEPPEPSGRGRDPSIVAPVVPSSASAAPRRKVAAPERKASTRRPTSTPAPTRRSRAWLWLLLVPLLLAGGVAALHFVPVERSVALVGVLAPAVETPVPARIRGRVEKLYSRVGDRVVQGDPLVMLVDLEVQAEIDALSARLEGLQRQAPVPVVVGGQIPDTLTRETESTEASLAEARQETIDVLAAFNRREAAFEALEAAQTKEASLRARLARLRAQVGDAGRRRQVSPGTPSDDALEEMARIIDRRQKLEVRQRGWITAPATGILLTGNSNVQVGDSVSRDQGLFVVADVTRLVAHLTVAGPSLGEVEAAGAAELIPEGFPGRRIPIELGKAGAAAQADGAFPLDAQVPNVDGALRPGQRVSVEVKLQPTNLLSELWSRVRG